ncbi:MAG: acyltransferase [Sphingobium sp.]|nr:acyltransferase [Sphingobium sp.]
MSDSRGQVIYVQYLRGVAAMLVVLYHMLVQEDWLYNPLPPLLFGAGGVDIFFVISGFVMFVAARHESPGEFWLKRIIRIVPLYWLATLIFLAMRHAHFGEPGIDGASISKSLFFIPYRVGPPTAPVYPFLVPGWSLNVEMFFYFLFGIGLMIGRPALFSGLAVVAVVLAGQVFPYHGPAFTLYTKPILLEFSAGLLLGWLWTGNRLSSRFWPLLVIGATLLLVSDMFGEATLVVRGIGGVLVMVGAIAAEGAKWRVRSSLLKALGDASYSIYLVHIPILLIFFAIMKRIPLHGPVQFIIYLALGLTLCAVGGIVSHHLVERPLTNALRRFVPRSSRKDPTAPISQTAQPTAST